SGSYTVSIMRTIGRTRIWSSLVVALGCALAGMASVACSKAKENASSMTESARQKAAEVSAEAKRASGELVTKAEQKGAEAVAAVEAKTGEIKKDVEAERVELMGDLQRRLGTIDSGMATLQKRLKTAKDGGKQELE